MEELIVYAVLWSIGYDNQDEYKEILNGLLIENPQDEVLLDLDGRSYKDAMLHLYHFFMERQFDIEQFGKTLMCKLKEVYVAETNLEIFGKQMYKLWQCLPRELSEREPFDILCYADDPLSWGDESQSRELFEKAIYYYND